MISARLIPAALFLASLTLAGVAKAEGKQHDHHHHGTMAVPADQAPVIKLEAIADPMEGWNIHVSVSKFRFAPERVNQAAQPGEGHAHLYVDGVKVARLYSPWYHLGAQAPGTHRLRVTLNANTHEELTMNGKSIAAELEIAE